MKTRVVGAVWACVLVVSVAACDPEQLIEERDQGWQRRTMADMRNMASANATMRIDTGRYAQSLAELGENGYMQVVPPTDGWGNAWVYSTGADTYTITSLGSDGARGPVAPADWVGEPDEPDIILTNGQFTQAPGDRLGAASRIK